MLKWKWDPLWRSKYGVPREIIESYKKNNTIWITTHTIGNIQKTIKDLSEEGKIVWGVMWAIWHIWVTRSIHTSKSTHNEELEAVMMREELDQDPNGVASR